MLDISISSISTLFLTCLEISRDRRNPSSLSLTMVMVALPYIAASQLKGRMIVSRMSLLRRYPQLYYICPCALLGDSVRYSIMQYRTQCGDQWQRLGRRAGFVSNFQCHCDLGRLGIQMAMGQGLFYFSLDLESGDRVSPVEFQSRVLVPSRSP